MLPRQCHIVRNGYLDVLLTIHSRDVATADQTQCQDKKCALHASVEEDTQELQSISYLSSLKSNNDTECYL